MTNGVGEHGPMVTERLRLAMRDTAEAVPAYSTFPGVVHRLRRRRRRQWLGAGVGVLVLLGGLALPALPMAGGATPAAPGLVVSLPDRLGTPLWGGLSVEDSPAGAASVVFGARNWWFDSSVGDLAVVGARTDTYRTVSTGGDRAGEQAILSPDGTRLASVGTVVDMLTGKSRGLPRPNGVVVTPAAWSPDGHDLAAIAYRTALQTQPDGADWPTPTQAVLYVINTASGAQQRIADLRTPYVYDGFTVAFAPDGAHLAYQSGDTVTVATVSGSTVSQFTVPDGTRLAGKGAWTSDGRGLTLVVQRRCCAPDPYPSRWQLQIVDTGTGVPLDRPQPPEVTGLVALRLLGWSPTGAAVAAAYYPEPDVTVTAFNVGAPAMLTDYAPVRTVAILSLTTDTAPRILLRAPDEVALNIDVADNVIAGGVVREGHPPTGLGPYLTIGLTVLAAIVLAIVVVLVLLLRMFRRRSSA